MKSGSSQTKEAEQRYTQAIQIYRSEGASLGLAIRSRAWATWKPNRVISAWRRIYYQQTIEISSAPLRPVLGLANALQSLGDLERGQKRFKEATAHYSTARDMYRQEKHQTGLAYTCAELARVSHALFDFTASIQYLNEAAILAGREQLAARLSNM